MARNKVFGIVFIVLLAIAILAVISFVPFSFSSKVSESKIKETFGENCVVQEKCGDMMYVDCNSAADGPAYYVRKGTLEILAKAGGFCMMANSCSGPPTEWTQCTTKNSQ